MNPTTDTPATPSNGSLVSYEKDLEQVYKVVQAPWSPGDTYAIRPASSDGWYVDSTVREIPASELTYLGNFDEAASGLRQDLKGAFAKLRKAGILARMNFSCCGGCGSYEIAEMLDKPNSKYHGGVFWHRQDDEKLGKTGRLYLNFGGDSDLTNNPGEATTEQVGQETVEILRAAGIPTEWDGTAATRILCHIGDAADLRAAADRRQAEWELEMAAADRRRIANKVETLKASLAAAEKELAGLDAS